MNAHYFLGMSYFKTSAYKTAANHLKLFADTHPKHPSIHGVLGLCYENINDPNSARKEYAAQLSVAPNSDMGKRASTRLQAIGVKATK
jgi:Tfp pilus assembly protein PilF